MTLLLGDCLEVMPTLEAGSVDAVVTDPPYGLTFMGKAWDDLTRVPDHTGPQWGGYGWHGQGPTPAAPMQAWHQRWATEAFRVAKPGAYLLAFGGTRTYHRLTCAIEDAGWIIRDCLVWAYASGFPKSRALLKPAWEPIVMARKPGPLRELAIDACRIEGAPRTTHADGNRHTGHGIFSEGQGGGLRAAELDTPSGRWPANVLLTADEDGRAIFDGDTPGVVGGGENIGGIRPALLAGKSQAGRVTAYGEGVGAKDEGEPYVGYGDSGTYSRFFLIPKADRAEREPIVSPEGGVKSGERFNAHPT